MLFTIVATALLVGLDQLLKYLAVRFLLPVGDVTVIPGVVGLKYVENTGAAFSILTGRQELLIVVTGIALLAVAFVLLFRRPKGRMEYAALLLIFAGGIGNLIDRIANGFVVDYVNLLFMNFAVFNFADTLVVVGFVLFVIALFKSELDNRKKQRADDAAEEAAPGEADGEASAPAAEASAAPEEAAPVPQRTDGDH